MNKTGELFIRTDGGWKDAWTEWGVFLSDTALTTLLEPLPLKAAVSNKSATMNGKQTRIEKPADVKVDERNFTLAVNLQAQSRDDLFRQILRFKAELKKRRVEIRTKYEEGVVYRCDYQSCSQFKSLFQGIAKFSLKLNEPNPANRGVTDIETYESNDI